MAFIVLLLGLTLIRTSYGQILNKQAPEFSWLTVIILVLSVAVKLWLSRFYKKLWRLTDSTAFSAAADDSRNDVITTLAVLVSTAVYALFAINIDGYTGLAVSVFIVISGIGLIKETLDPLLGQPPEPELIDEITRRVTAHDGIIGMHDLVVHNYGPGRLFCSLHAEVDAKADMLESHDMIDNIEHEFKHEMGLETVIHIDPVITDDPYVNELRQDTEKLIHGIDNRLDLHDFRIVHGPTHTNLIFDLAVPCGFDKSDGEIVSLINEMLHKTRPTFNAVITVDRTYS